MVRNHYQFRVLNKRNQPASVKLSLANPPAGYTLSGADQTIELPAHGETKQTAIVIVPHGQYQGAGEITFRIEANPGDVVFDETVRFLGPDPRSLRKPE
jgi:hypothetical protein